jgi:hypothetical protein
VNLIRNANAQERDVLEARKESLLLKDSELRKRESYYENKVKSADIRFGSLSCSPLFIFSVYLIFHSIGNVIWLLQFAIGRKKNKEEIRRMQIENKN